MHNATDRQTDDDGRQTDALSSISAAVSTVG